MPAETQPTTSKNLEMRGWLSALCCALVLPLLALIIRPFAEIGIDDDWSYIRTAQILALTGHLVYNGWATAMLGWLAYAGALLIHLFGFSFTVTRQAVLLIGMATALLVHRSFSRCGLSESNATLGTLALIASPLFLAVTYDFMTDVPGLFCIVACFYCCVRALQAQGDKAALAWIVLAAASNAVGGTVRQIAWLGVLVMVPCTLWLLRGRRSIVVPGMAVWLGGAGAVFWFLHWFHQQPYSLPEHLLRGQVTRGTAVVLVERLLPAALEWAMLLLPVSLPFTAALLTDQKLSIRLRQQLTTACVVLLLIPTLVLGLEPRHRHWLAPFLGYEVSVSGVGGLLTLKGEDVRVLSVPIQLALTVTVFASIFFFACLAWVRRSDPKRMTHRQGNSLRSLLIPFSLAYFLLLLPRAPFDGIFDRYLLPLQFVGFLGLLRLYQAWVGERAPWLGFALVALFASYGVAGRHDNFAGRRACVLAIDRLRAQGIPRDAIDGPWEYNGWTQIEKVGYVADPNIVMPAGSPPMTIGAASPRPDPCPFVKRSEFSALKPQYALSLDPKACGGALNFAPLTYRTWLAPHTRTIYIVRSVP